MRPRSLEKFLHLAAADRALLLRSFLLLGTTRLALWLLPLRVVRRLLAPGVRPASSPGATSERVAWAVSTAARVVPRATCLPQALAAEALLVRDGYPAALRIGVVKNTRGRVVAHAWVESGGRVVVGELREGLSRFTTLPPLPDARA